MLLAKQKETGTCNTFNVKNEPLISTSFEPTMKEIESYYNIREKCYREVPDGPKKFDGGEDAYDRMSDILIVKDGGVVIGGARVFGKRAGCLLTLPLEDGKPFLDDFFPHLGLDENSYCEFGRLAILKEYRSTNLLKIIVTALCDKSIERGYSYLFSMSPLQQARCYRMIIKAINFPHPYEIHTSLDLPKKDEDECGNLRMYLASLRFPKTLKNVSTPNQSKVEH